MSTITLVKAIYKHVDITRYYVSVSGGKLTEVTADVFSRYFKQGFTVRSSSESYLDRTLIIREVEIL